jgi:hypothetical protein
LVPAPAAPPGLIPIDLLLYSHQEVDQLRQYSQQVVSEAYRDVKQLHAG